MFSRKVTLIEKHLRDPMHPLSKLQKLFSKELEEYYELFLEVNHQNNAGILNTTLSNSQRSYTSKT